MKGFWFRIWHSDILFCNKKFNMKAIYILSVFAKRNASRRILGRDLSWIEGNSMTSVNASVGIPLGMVVAYQWNN
jgi:hypothetical protein